MRASVSIGMPVRASKLISISLNKNCSQSSFSKYSRRGEANFAVLQIIPGDFAFHTNFEDRPWWSIDLAGRFSKVFLLISNRRVVGRHATELRMRAVPLRVEVADESRHWRLAAVVEEIFEDRETGRPLCVTLDETESGAAIRYIRLVVEKKMTALHLYQVEVFIDAAAATAKSPDFSCNKGNFYSEFHAALNNGLSYEAAHLSYSRDNLSFTTFSSIEQIEAIVVLRGGRLGNQILSTIKAFVFAGRHGIKKIFMDFEKTRSAMNMPARFVWKEIVAETVIPAYPIVGSVMTANFFKGRYLPSETERLPQTYVDVLREVIPQLFFPGLIPGSIGLERVVIHIRSGDLFAAGSKHVHPGYVQPPLAYYIACIQHAAKRASVLEVIVVFEDRANPVVDALEAYLLDIGQQYRMQSGALIQDVATIYGARRLITSFGTFAPAIIAASMALDSIYFFRASVAVHLIRVGAAEIFIARDIGQGFTRQDDWRNTVEQRATMLTYPVDAILIEKFE